MPTYHVQLTAVCDVIVEAHNEHDAVDRAEQRLGDAAQYKFEAAKLIGALEGEALQTAYRYFPEHLAQVELERFYMVDDPVPGTIYTSPSVAEEDAHTVYRQLSRKKLSGEALDWVEQDFMEQYQYNNTQTQEPTDYKDKMMACFDEDDNFVGLVGVQANGTYKIVKK